MLDNNQEPTDENKIIDSTGGTTEAEPASEPAASGETVTDTSTTTATTESPATGDAGTDTTKKAVPWFQRRIDQLTFEKHEERRRVEKLEKQTEALLSQLADTRVPKAAAVVQPAQQAPTTTVTSNSLTDPSPVVTQPPTQNITDAEINALAERRAGEIARAAAFNKSCNDVYTAGTQNFDDFDKALNTFKMLGGIPTQMLELAVDMPGGHKVLYALGKDPDLAEKVVKLTPTRMAMELARLESSLAKPVSSPVSKATPPIKPIDGSSRAEADPEKMSVTEFVKWREADLKSKGKRR